MRHRCCIHLGQEDPMKTLVLLGSVGAVVALAAPASARDKTVQRRPQHDVAVSTTRTTAAEGRDVAESRADYRRRFEGKRWTLAPLVGYASSGLGVGVGGRFGYTFETPIYLGGNFVYQTGADIPRAHSFYPSVEVGYDLGVETVLLRPYAGLGPYFRAGDVPASSTGLIYPGFTLHWLIPSTPAFLGADTRMLLPFEGNAALAVMATGGVNL
jgi:hypothetical protein